jgi:hypothetical protein
MPGAQLYDTIGATYTMTRRTEPRPISLMGSGSTQWSSGTDVNAATFGTRNLFGGSTSTITPATTSPTKAGSTKNLGYTDLAASTRRGVHQAPLQVSPPSTEPAQLTTAQPTQTGGNAGEALKAVTEHYGPREGLGRSAEFDIGATSSLPGAFPR